MKINRIKETCLYCKDLPASRDFYEGKLGMECFSFLENKFAFFRAGESVLLCFDPEHAKTGNTLPPHWATGPYHLAFEVDQEEYGDWKSRVLEKGIEITYEHKWSDEQYSFYFNDLDGNVLEIVMTGLWDYLS